MSQQDVSFVGPGEHDSIWRAILRAERRLFALEQAKASLQERIEALEKQQEARQYAEIHKGSLEPPRRQYS